MFAGALAASLCVVVGFAPAQPPAPGDDAAWEALEKQGAWKAETKAGQDSIMKFTVPTEIREILVAGGKTVKKGDVLVRARDADVAAAMETQRFQATNEAEVHSAEAQSEFAQFRYARGTATGTLSPSELKELEIQAKVAAINIEAAKARLETERLKLKYYEGQYERYRLEAPFDGVISELNVELGQGVSDQNPVLRIVNIDRLRIDAWPKTDETQRLRLGEGSPAWVMLRGRSDWMQGKVMYVNAVADSVSQTRQARVEVENPDHWPAGTPALVRFTAPTAAAPARAAVDRSPSP